MYPKPPWFSHGKLVTPLNSRQGSCKAAFNCLIDIIVFGKDALSGRLSYTPVYVRAIEEGVAI
jgi:hypothetical protein